MEKQPVLAVIGKVIEVKAIEGADRIRSATVVCGHAGKWTGVVDLDTSVDDLVTVFLQDAILPPEERYSFMQRHKYRVKIARFKGSPSECLIMKLGDETGRSIGDDRTQELGVTKHCKPLPANLAGKAKGNFPDFIPKTDEENFQRVRELVARMGEGYVATLKMDGTSCTAFVDEAGVLRVCSRNLELVENEGNVYWMVARKLLLDRLVPIVALQFEICGPAIQNNPAGFTEFKPWAFKAYDIYGRRYMDRGNFERMCEAFEIPIAPVLFTGDQPKSDDELRLIASQVKYINGKPAEGVVISSLNGDWSFKVINPEYRD